MFVPAQENKYTFTTTFTSIAATGIDAGTIGGFRNETSVNFTITSESAGELFLEKSDEGSPETYRQVGRIATRASGVSTNTVAFRGGLNDTQLATEASRRLKGKIRCRWIPLSAPSSGSFTVTIDVEYDVA